MSDGNVVAWPSATVRSTRQRGRTVGEKNRDERVRPKTPRRRQLALVLAGAAAVGSWLLLRPAPLPAAATVLQIDMNEYAFDYDQAGGDVLRSGRVVFRARNVGRLEHALRLVQLPEDMPGTIQQQLRSSERRAVTVVMDLLARPPGSEGFFAVDLAPGRYAMICFVEDADGRQHAVKGMSSEFWVR